MLVWKADYRPDPEQARAFRVPTLVVVGGRDRMIPADCSRSLYESLPTPAKEFALIERAGHVPFVEHLDSSLPVVTGWLERTP